MTNKILLVVIAAAMLTGCHATVETTPRLDIESIRVYETDIDEAWDGVTDVLAESKYPVAVIEKDSGFVTTQRINGGSRWVYREQVKDGVEYSEFAKLTRHSLSVRAKAVDGGTKVSVITNIECMLYYIDRGWLVPPLIQVQGVNPRGFSPCESHGDIERDFFNALDKKLKQAKEPMENSKED